MVGYNHAKALLERRYPVKFFPNGQGELVTNLSGALAYQSFRPTPLQQLSLLEFGPTDISLLLACARKLGEVEGMVRYVPNVSMYLTMYVRKEALLSAQIEGTQCTFDDVLDPMHSTLFYKDVADVVHYVDAMTYAMQRMDELPLCIRLLKEAHERLLGNARGSEKQPGTLRASQNWIGPGGCTLATASYVPPNVDDMRHALADLEVYIHASSAIDPVVKAALVHYQFETIHPFLDGNGRLGRLLITLSLINDGALTNAAFYPSYEFKARRAEYYERLTAVRERGDYLGWVRFFAECMLASAEDACCSMAALVELHEKTVQTIREAMPRNSAAGAHLLDVLEEHPIVSVPFVEEKMGISRTSASKLVKEFEGLGILRSTDQSRRRYRTYGYEEYLAILRAGSDPIR